MPNTPATPSSTKVSNDQMVLFVAVAVVIFSGLSISRSGDDSKAKPSQVESVESDSSDAAEETQTTGDASSQSTRTEDTSRTAGPEVSAFWGSNVDARSFTSARLGLGPGGSC